MFRWLLLALVGHAACGGGGGGSSPPQTAPLRLEASSLTIGPTALVGELTVALADGAALRPALLQVAIELPPQLALPPAARLAQIAAVVDLDGDMVDGRFVVLCGDARNPAAAPLPQGPLFRLRLGPSVPRQPGSYTVRLRELRAASAAGDDLAVDPNPVAVTVTVL